ncbi:MAG: hypothetical protein ABR520_11300 [Mycobacteriales bacterium]|nr:hypothetical protein [Actinomycetota bacterium]
MTEAELVTLITAGGTAIAAGLRWALRLWATVRREAIAAAAASAAQASADHRQMIDALIAQARSMAELGGKIEALAVRLDAFIERRERTPVEFDDDTRPPRHRTNPHGYRPPRAGGRDD